MKRIVGRVVFIRHGETEYTNQFPDLTCAGKETIMRAAAKLRQLRNQYSEPLRIMSSPATRALGSAAIVAKIMGHSQRVIKTQLLAPAGVMDADRGAEIFNEHIAAGGFRKLAAAYSSDKRYEDPEIFEPRTQVVARFYKYLGQLASNLLTCAKPMFVVCISHYEVLHHLVETSLCLDYANDAPLGFGEIVLMSLYDIGPGSKVEICLTFRHRTRNMAFDYKKELLVL